MTVKTFDSSNDKSAGNGIYDNTAFPEKAKRTADDEIRIIDRQDQMEESQFARSRHLAEDAHKREKVTIELHAANAVKAAAAELEAEKEKILLIGLGLKAAVDVIMSAYERVQKAGLEDLALRQKFVLDLAKLDVGLAKEFLANAGHELAVDAGREGGKQAMMQLGRALGRS